MMFEKYNHCTIKKHDNTYDKYLPLYVLLCTIRNRIFNLFPFEARTFQDSLRHFHMECHLLLSRTQTFYDNSVRYSYHLPDFILKLEGVQNAEIRR